MRIFTQIKSHYFVCLSELPKLNINIIKMHKYSYHCVSTCVYVYAHAMGWESNWVLRTLFQLQFIMLVLHIFVCKNTYTHIHIYPCTIKHDFLYYFVYLTSFNNNRNCSLIEIHASTMKLSQLINDCKRSWFTGLCVPQPR